MLAPSLKTSKGFKFDLLAAVNCDPIINLLGLKLYNPFCALPGTTPSALISRPNAAASFSPLVPEATFSTLGNGFSLLDFTLIDTIPKTSLGTIKGVLKCKSKSLGVPEPQVVFTYLGIRPKAFDIRGVATEFGYDVGDRGLDSCSIQVRKTLLNQNGNPAPFLIDNIRVCVAEANCALLENPPGHPSRLTPHRQVPKATATRRV